ncbi:acetylornithine deacetylase [Ktedonosporobacter rubrisoli]|uniref:Acetylornithine deacetylase n=1 Tax=Ktedonosporobacter rubrisoli TaxID=2509675 RepID=A0A4P6K4S7_KTERU|nr:acetylornithine deacetylase [Ktedonosporobacter rubrisoli]QBD83075.1 acetylornithine deacetylase [Ktedonosporobacter rubrisoli]
MPGAPIQESELWELSRQLISFNTVSSLSNVAAAEYLANFLENIGFSVQLVKETVQNVEKANVLAWIGPQVPGGLIISGHIDIVPFEGQPGWKTDPLVMSTDGERIFGRGVSDMKVFLAQAILAAKRTSLQSLKRPLMFIFTCDEEVAGQGAGRLIHVIPELFHDYPLPRVALIGEPTNFDIFPAHKGYASFDIVVHGKGGHSSAPHKGLNAIEKMSDVIELLKEANQQLLQQASAENRRLFPEVPGSVFNCGLITGGLAPNMIAEECRLTTSVRIAPGDQAEQLLAPLQERWHKEIVTSMKRVAPESDITLQDLTITPPLSSPSDDEFCHFLCQLTGKQADRGAPYATDGGQFQQIGIDSYIWGPGLLEEAHQPNESLPVSHFITGMAQVERIIHGWCIERDAS